MNFVQIVISGEDFVTRVKVMNEWLAEGGIRTSFSHSRDNAGNVRVRIAFPRDDDARLFVERFGGKVLENGNP